MGVLRNLVSASGPGHNSGVWGGCEEAAARPLEAKWATGCVVVSAWSRQSFAV